MPHPIQHLVLLHPRAARLRRRADRVLRRARPSIPAEMWYRAQLYALVDELKAAGAAIADEMRPRWPAVADAGPPDLETVLDRAARKFGGLNRRAKELAEGAALRNRKAVDKALTSSVKRSIGLDIGPLLRPGERIQAAVEKATADNIALITSMPPKYLARIKDVVEDNWTAGGRWEDMVDDIRRAGKITETRAWVIARDQTSKMSAAFNGARQQQVGIRRYIWRDCGIYSGPHRVRDSHRAMNGKVCEWAKPPEVDGENVHPGEPVLCRCVPEPVVNLDLIEDDEPLEQAA